MSKGETIAVKDNRSMPAPVNVDSQRISQFVYTIRGKQVMLDADLAQFYQVETRILNRNVTRNAERFPEDFRFQLSKEEFDGLTSQSGMSNDTGRGGRRYLPYAYTEQGMTLAGEILEKTDEPAEIVCRITDEKHQQVDEYVPRLLAQRIAEKRATQDENA